MTKKRTIILPRQTSVIPNLPNGSQVYREWQSQKKVSFSFLPAKKLRDKLDRKEPKDQGCQKLTKNRSIN